MLHFPFASRFAGTFVLVFGLSLAGTAIAQAPDNIGRGDTVTWSVQPAAAARPGQKINLTLNGTVAANWHVYSLKQAPEGPTPLLVTLGRNTVAATAGAVTESKPITIHDAAFGLQTGYHENDFALTVPVRLKPHLAAGAQTIPVNVRFQTCNGRICQPPKTVLLSFPLDVKAGG